MRSTSWLTRPSIMGSLPLMLCTLKAAATALRTAFHVSSLGLVSRLGVPCGSVICAGRGGCAGDGGGAR